MKRAIGISLIATLLFAGCLNQNQPNNTSQTTEEATTAKVEDQSFIGSIKDAIEKAIPMKCKYSVDGVESEAVISGKNYHGKMTVNNQLSNVIVKEECMWSWDDTKKQGIKFCVDPEEIATNEASASSIWDQKQLDVVNIEFNCQPTVISPDEFNPPTDIAFQDMQQMLDSVKKIVADPNSKEVQDMLKKFAPPEGNQ